MLEWVKYQIAKFFGRTFDFYRHRGTKIGNNCKFMGRVNFGTEPYLVQIGDQVKITNDVRFITHDGGVNVLRNMNLLSNADIFGRIFVGNNVFIGNCVIIMPNVTIGDNVVIGAGSIVTNDIPSNSVAAGVPAKVINTIDAYHEKVKMIADFTKNLSKIEKKKYLLKKYDINDNRGV